MIKLLALFILFPYFCHAILSPYDPLPAPEVNDFGRFMNGNILPDLPNPHRLDRLEAFLDWSQRTFPNPKQVTKAIQTRVMGILKSLRKKEKEQTTNE